MMKRRPTTAAIALLLLFLAGAPRLAAQDANLQTLRSAPEAKDHPGADVVVLYDSTDVDVMDSG